MTLRRLLPLAALLVAAGLVMAQPPAKTGNPEPKKNAPKQPPRPAPGSLEDTLEKSLRNSADIKAAEAKVRDAEAELNRVRQQVLTKATGLHVDLSLAKRMLAVAEQNLALHQAAMERGAAGREGLLAAQAMVEKHRGEVETLETELKSLRGEFAVRGVASVAFSPEGQALWAAMPDGTIRVWDVNGNVSPYPLTDVKGTVGPAVKAPMLERVKKLLDREVELNATGVPALEAVQHLLKVTDAQIPLRETLADGAGDARVALQGKLPVGAWFQAVEDSDLNLRIVVRDYGLLLTSKDRVPEGALRVQDLWKGNYAELRTPADPKGPKP
jgi:hypothetical protein